MWLEVNMLDCLQLVISTLGSEKEEIACVVTLRGRKSTQRGRGVLKGSFLQIADPDSVKLGFCWWISEEEES